MRAGPGGWRLLIPYGADSLAQLLDQRPWLAHTVVWLDEIAIILCERIGVAQMLRLLASQWPGGDIWDAAHRP